MLEAMPSSWVAWSGRLADAVDELDEERLWPIADALTLPRALGDTALMHAVLELVAPGELQHARTYGYLEEAKKVRTLCVLCMLAYRAGATHVHLERLPHNRPNCIAEIYARHCYYYVSDDPT